MNKSGFAGYCILVLGVILFIGWLCCGLPSGEKTEVSASDTESLQGFTIRADKSEYVRIWTDPETGVQYLLFSAVGRGGICPRYNADGSLMIVGES